MAREGAMLGVPSIYCGIREMKANQILIDKNVLLHLSGKPLLSKINEIITAPFDSDYQIQNRENLLNEWVDMLDFMKQKILDFKKNGERAN